MYISNVTPITSYDGSIRNLILDITFDDVITDIFVEEILPKLTVISNSKIEDIAGQIIYDKNVPLNFKILENGQLVGVNHLKVQIDLKHNSLIPTFDNFIGAKETSEFSLKLLISDTIEKTEIVKDLKNIIISESNLQKLKDLTLKIYDDMKTVATYVNKNVTDERIKKITDEYIN